ncbi:MAG: type II secretion system F family protein [Chloroflexota bacterium]|nr:type II secretion system F family protein [Chloroflexota bacterium]
MDPAVLVAILAAAAVLLLFLGIFGGRRVSPTERIEQVAVAATEARTRDTRGQGKSLRSRFFGGRAAAGVDRVVEQRDWGSNMARELARADLQLRPSEFLAIRVGAIIGAPLVTFLLGKTILPTLDNAIALLVAGVLGWWVPRFYVNRRKAKRLQAFNDHLSDTITLVANALRAGASFLQAIELVVRETQPPISTEFNRVIREVNLGLPFEQALANMVRRVRSDDLELMATAISIQHQVGGNLAEILDSIAFTIRERIRIIGEIRTLTAQQRMSGYVVAGLPIFLVIILSLIAPKFMEPMFGDPTVFGIPVGVIVLAMGAIMMAIGFLAIRKIVDIEV